MNRGRKTWKPPTKALFKEGSFIRTVNWEGYGKDILTHYKTPVKNAITQPEYEPVASLLYIGSVYAEICAELC
jgi:hypothetical protein